MTLINKRFLKRNLEKNKHLFSSEKRDQLKNHLLNTLDRIEKKKFKKEESEKVPFLQRLFELLGYSINSTLEFEYPADGRSVDAVLGNLSENGLIPEIAIEWKGVNTKNLDKGKAGETPVSQMWDYMGKVGADIGIVGNFIEWRLYTLKTKQSDYHSFSLREVANNDDKLDELIFFLKEATLLRKNNKQSLLEQLIDQSEKEQAEISKEFYKEYKKLRSELFSHLIENNPETNKYKLLEKTQKILDRMIFVMFCEDNQLLPMYTIKNVYSGALNHFGVSATKVWDAYKGLFIGVDKGMPEQNIPAYNGGLFALDDVLDRLILKDEIFKGFVKLAEYFFDSDLDVNILGHIFEQSISDIEEIKESLELVDVNGSNIVDVNGDAIIVNKTKKPALKGKRKKDGIYYTPSYITDYIVEETVGAWLRDNPDMLDQIKILDPAGGSGAFPNQVHSYLARKHAELVNEQAIDEGFGDALATIDSTQIDKSILNNNIFMVDLQPESVEIAKLSLWLKTARKDQKLNNLDSNIKCGNSLIDNPEIAGDKAFDWSKEFPEILNLHGLSVRKYQASDEIKVKQIILEGWQDSVFIDIDKDLINQNAKRSSFPSLYDDNITKFVCLKNGEIAGYLVLDKKDKNVVFVGDFYIDRNYRKIGAGSFLFNHGLEYLKKEGFKKLKLYLDDDNLPAKKFYTKFGFVPEESGQYEWLDESGEVVAKNNEHLMNLDLDQHIFEQRHGFDVVVGNPPYVNIANISETEIRKYLQNNYKTVKNKSDLYSIFIERGVSLLKQDGYLGYIISNSWLGTDSFSEFRKFLIENTKIIKLVKMPSDVFEDATVTPVILILKKEKVEENYEIVLVEYVDEKFHKMNHTLSYERVKKTHGYTFSFEPEILFKNETVKLGEIAEFSLGIKTSNDKRFILDQKIDENCYPILRGKDIQRYFYKEPEKWIWYKPKLMMEKKGAGPRRVEYFLREKIFIQDIAKSIIATLDNNNIFSNDTLSLIHRIDGNFNSKFILAILNSRIATKWFKSNFPEGLHIKINQLQQLPIPKATPEQQSQIAELVDQIMGVKKDQQDVIHKSLKTIEREYMPKSMSKKLKEFWKLDYEGFLNELKKQKVELSLSQKEELEDYFRSKQKFIIELESKADQIDEEIETKVRGLYGL